MGWTSYHRDKHAESDRDHFAAKFDDHYRIIAHGTASSVFYAAVRDTRTGEVFAYIALMRWSREAYNFAYKDFTETSHPCYYQAPKAVLNALTPTDDEEANVWRERCHRHHAQRDYLRRHMKPGMKVRLSRTVTFEGGDRSDTFTYRQLGKGTRGFLVLGRSRCQIPNWRDYVYALIHPDHGPVLTPVGKDQAKQQNRAPRHADAPTQPTSPRA
ncbi:hypothetical protein [Streptomyces sp. NBC_00470]|uniref:DUF6927 domain-containing protein n=1 Tax=Streptomyces sp. NBC_00470 TaxID=2975753 RepID=UPI002F912190